MEYDTKAFFSEHEADDVTAFAVIDTNEESQRHRIAEKWERDEREGGPTWVTYWIPEGALLERVNTDGASYKQQLTDKQFEGILNLSDVSSQYQEADKAAA